MVTGFSGLLTATVFLPAAAALIILIVPFGQEHRGRNIRGFAVLVALADLVLALGSLLILLGFLLL